MIRKFFVVTAVAAGLLLGGLAPSASAQLDGPAVRQICALQIAALSPEFCATAQTYPGAFTGVMPPAPTGPYGFGTKAPIATSAGAAPVADSAPALATTGAETTVLAYLGTGLIGFGALASGVRRRLR